MTKDAATYFVSSFFPLLLPPQSNCGQCPLLSRRIANSSKISRTHVKQPPPVPKKKDGCWIEGESSPARRPPTLLTEAVRKSHISFVFCKMLYSIRLGIKHIYNSCFLKCPFLKKFVEFRAAIFLFRKTG